ncbi:short chain dehydrogenase/reductase [Trichoderma chlorosporum]
MYMQNRYGECQGTWETHHHLTITSTYPAISHSPQFSTYSYITGCNAGILEVGHHIASRLDSFISSFPPSHLLCSDTHLASFPNMSSSKVLASIGAITAAALAIKLVSTISVYLLPSKLQKYAHASSDGRPPWALVTGASDGIGRCFVEELALRGFNVVLHGRNQAKLDAVKAELQARHPERSFRILIADASKVQCVSCLQAGEKHSLDFDAIKEQLRDLNLTVLINNAGGGSRDPVYLPLSDSSEERVTENVSVNALFPLHLTRALLPQLAQSSPALVMNISSLADAGLPLLASYGSSKAFLMTLTRTINLEMAFSDKADVECLGVRVGNVTGVSHNKEAASLFTPGSDTMARAALDRAGHGHVVVTGHWAHALQEAGVNMMPQFLANRVMIDAIRVRRDAELKSS